LPENPVSGQEQHTPDTLLSDHLNAIYVEWLQQHRLSFTDHIEYALSFSNWLYLNEPQKFPGLILQHELGYTSGFKATDILSVKTCLDHELACHWLIDSLVMLSSDRNVLKNDIDLSIHKHFALNFSSTTETRLLKGFTYQASDTAGTQRTHSSGFFSPLYLNLSFGFGYNNMDIGIFKIGISSAKLTWLQNRKLFETTGQQVLYGIKQPRRHLFEYGFSSSLLFDHKLGKLLTWKCDISAFKDFEMPVDLKILNIICLKTSKYFKTSIKTRVLYNEHISKSCRVENVVTVGFYFEK